MILLLNYTFDYFMRLKFSLGVSVSQDVANLSVLYIYDIKETLYYVFFCLKKCTVLYKIDR